MFQSADAQKMMSIFLPTIPVFSGQVTNRIQDVMFFAPDWDKETSTALAPQIREAKQLVLAATLCGVQEDELEVEIMARWPELGCISLSLEGEGTRMVIDAIS